MNFRHITEFKPRSFLIKSEHFQPIRRIRIMKGQHAGAIAFIEEGQ